MIFGVFMRKKEGGGKVQNFKFKVPSSREAKEKRCAIIKFSDADDADDTDKWVQGSKFQVQGSKPTAIANSHS